MINAPTIEYAALKDAPLEIIRESIRQQQYEGHTSGLAKGRLQCNLVILPKMYVDDFRAYCMANPKPCPLAAISTMGSPHLPDLGATLDIRTDVPKYFVYRNGVLSEQTNDISRHWRDDFTVFAIGCSFTFEHALVRAGIAMRHMDRNTTVPMFRTSLETIAHGPFHGGMVVSMRPIREADVERVKEICDGYPLSHGMPVHIGAPEEIGIDDVQNPDWGEAVPILPGEVPVFWGCGVTPQAAIMRAKIPFCITHAPGAMLVCDVEEAYTGSLI